MTKKYSRYTVYLVPTEIIVAEDQDEQDVAIDMLDDMEIDIEEVEYVEALTPEEVKEAIADGEIVEKEL